MKTPVPPSAGAGPVPPLPPAPRPLLSLRDSPGRILPFCLLAATGVLMARISWLRWPDAIIDYGRELYVPWRINAGELLYRDIPHLYGPLAHYFNALLFRLFGTGLRTLVAFNLLLIAVLTWCIYGIFRRAFDRLTATLCGVVFLGMFAFGRYAVVGNFNFVCPYAHEVTYGITLSFLMVPALAKYHERRNRRWAAVGGLLLGMIFLTKVEVFAAALAAAGATFLLGPLRTRSLKTLDARAVIAACGGFAVPPLLFGAFFAARTTVREAAGMITASFSSVGLAPIVTSDLYLMVSGLDRPLLNLVRLLEVAAAYLAFFLGTLLLARLTARLRGAGRPWLAATLLLLFGAAAGTLVVRTGWWDQFGRPWPLFVLLYVLWLALSSRAGSGEPAQDRRDVPRTTVAVFGLLLLLKIMLRVNLIYYGFALALPAALIVVALIVYHLPRAVERRGGDGFTARVAAAGVVMVFVTAHIDASRKMYDMLTYPVGSDRDRFYTFGPDYGNTGPVMEQTLKAIERLMPQDAGFVVIPEGVMLNYLSRRRNPGRWFEFTPPFVAAMGEARMCRDLEAGRPDYVLLTERPTGEYGAVYFGSDYGFQLKSWIMGNYAPVSLAGGRLFSYQGEFGIAIAERKAGPGSGPDFPREKGRRGVPEGAPL